MNSWTSKALLLSLNWARYGHGAGYLCSSLSILCNLFWIGLSESPHFDSAYVSLLPALGFSGRTYLAWYFWAEPVESDMGLPGSGAPRMDGQKGGVKDKKPSNYRLLVNRANRGVQDSIPCITWTAHVLNIDTACLLSHYPSSSACFRGTR